METQIDKVETIDISVKDLKTSNLITTVSSDISVADLKLKIKEILKTQTGRKFLLVQI
jgi:hypothetical protein